MSELDFTRTMAPETAVSKAEEALNLPPGSGVTDSVATLAAAMMVREGLVAVARAIVAVPNGGSPDAD